MITTLSSSSAAILSLPSWVQILKELGVPGLFGTIIGGTIGLLSSILVFHLKTRKEHTEKKREVAQRVLATIRTYFVSITSQVGQFVSFPTTREEAMSIRTDVVSATRELNEMQALVDLFITDKVQDRIERIKELVYAIVEEGKGFPKAGKTEFSNEDLASGREYLKELSGLIDDLKKWVNS